MMQRAGGQGLALLVDAGAVFLGKDAEVVDQVVGRGEAIDVHDLGDQDCGRGLADAGDGDDLDVRRGGQVREGGGQQLPEVLLGVLAVTDLVSRDRGPAPRPRSPRSDATDCSAAWCTASACSAER